MNKNKLVYLCIITFVFLIASCKKKTECELHGHDFTQVTCEQDSVCKRCNIISEKALGHDFTQATCEQDSVCKKCNAINKKASNHKFIDASFDTPKTCEICGYIFLEAKLYSTTLSIGTSTNLYIDGYFEFSNLSIEIADESIISIDDYGKITGLNKGNTTITIKTKEGKSNILSYDIDVIGKMPNLFITYNKMAIGDQTTIYIKNFDELDESSINDFQINVTPSDLLQINDDLSLTALKLGEATITLTSKIDNRISSQIKVTVVDENAELLIYGIDATTPLQVGDYFYMKANLSYDNEDLSWLSSNKNIASISKDGYVSIISEGYVTINAYDAKDKTKKANYSFYVKGKKSIDYISHFLHIAINEKGTKEVGENYQKYGEWYGNNGQPWCAMFVSWCWNRAGLSNDILLKYQGCYTGIEWCTKQNIMHFVQDYDFTVDLGDGYSRYQYAEEYTPVSGDIIFFLSGGMSHTGIAIYADEQYLYTIEGNTSDQVDIKRWNLNDGRITGYAHPKYPDYEGERENFSWIKDIQEDGTYLWTNVSLQQKVD